MTPATLGASAPESIVVSLEWAKKLKEAGWSGNSHWLWAYHCFDLPADSEFQKPFLCGREHEDHYHQYKFYLAPTWSDIWFSLPSDLLMNARVVDIALDAEFLDQWNPAIFKMEKYAEFQSRRAEKWEPKQKTPHDDVAAMYCYLAENKLLPTS